mgnify:CR=1 FL=1
MISVLRGFVKSIPTLILSIALAIAVWISAVTAEDPIQERLYPRPVTIESTPVPTTPVPTTPPAQTDPISNPTVIAAGIGIITAGIGAFATIYTQKLKEKKE